MNWWDVAEIVIGGTLVAAVTTVVSLRLFYPTLRFPKNSLWQRLKMKLGWRWDHLLQMLVLETRVGAQQYRQLEIRLPVTNVGGRAAEHCAVDLRIKRFPDEESLLIGKAPQSGYSTITHNPQWLDMTKQNPQAGFVERDIASGYLAWFSFARVFIASGNPTVDFNCPGEFLVTPSSMAVRLRENAKPLSGLLTVHSKNAMPTRCYFTLRNRRGVLFLNLNRMFSISLGAIGVWFPVPFLTVNHRFEVSDLTELPGEVGVGGGRQIG